MNQLLSLFLTIRSRKNNSFVQHIKMSLESLLGPIVSVCGHLLVASWITYNSMSNVSWGMLLVLALAAYWITSTVDPGFIPSHAIQEDQSPTEAQSARKWCDVCQLLQPPRSHHCKCLWCFNFNLCFVVFNSLPPFIVYRQNVYTLCGSLGSPLLLSFKLYWYEERCFLLDLSDS